MASSAKSLHFFHDQTWLVQHSTSQVLFRCCICSCYRWLCPESDISQCYIVFFFWGGGRCFMILLPPLQCIWTSTVTKFCSHFEHIYLFLMLCLVLSTVSWGRKINIYTVKTYPCYWKWIIIWGRWPTDHEQEHEFRSQTSNKDYVCSGRPIFAKIRSRGREGQLSTVDSFVRTYPTYLFRYRL